MDKKQEEMKKLLKNKYHSSRIELLIAIALTIVNIILIFTASSVYLPFAPSFPSAIIFYYALNTGLLPGFDYKAYNMYEFLDTSYLVVACIIAAAIIAAYTVFWFLSKKRPVFLLVSLVFFSLDVVSILLGFTLTTPIIDLIFHGIIIYYLYSGYRAAKQLEELEKAPIVPEKSSESEKSDYDEEEEYTDTGDAPISSVYGDED